MSYATYMENKDHPRSYEFLRKEQSTENQNIKGFRNLVLLPSVNYNAMVNDQAENARESIPDQVSSKIYKENTDTDNTNAFDRYDVPFRRKAGNYQSGANFL